MEDKLITMTELADLLRVSIETLKQRRIEARKAGEHYGPPDIGNGRSLRFRYSDAQEFIRALESRP